jgi:hypothetical protein
MPTANWIEEASPGFEIHYYFGTAYSFFFVASMSAIPMEFNFSGVSSGPPNINDARVNMGSAGRSFTAHVFQAPGEVG